jgi:hypothetical protein
MTLSIIISEHSGMWVVSVPGALARYLYSFTSQRDAHMFALERSFKLGFEIVA